MSSDRKDRNCTKAKKWKEEVLKKGIYRCKKCGSIKKLVTHHIVEWKENPKLRFDINNGEVLCRSCHMRHHATGKKYLLGRESPKKGIKTGISYWKGKKFSKEHKAKLSKAKKGKSTWNKGLKGQMSHMFGKQMAHKGKKWIIDPETGKRKWID
jgi:HNH endonuclease/NUMOD3 motif-containing protein